MNRVSSIALIVLSLAAVLAVLPGALIAVFTGHTQPPERDEGTAAHIFQLSIVALGPAILLFLASADWRQPLRSIRPLTFPAAVLVLAFSVLYYFEHLR
jgi:hypothetical protein